MGQACSSFPQIEELHVSGALVAPASFAQRRLLFLSAMDGGQAPYHLTGAMRIEGALDIPKLRDAFALVAARHESLRTSFAMDGDALVQVVHPAVALDFQMLVAGPDDPTEAARKELTPFDLSRAPLWRVRILSLPASKYILVLDFHHLIADGMSYDIVVQDVAAAYAGRDLGSQPTQFRTLASRQARRDPQDFGGHERFWRDHLSLGASSLELPSDFQRPKVKDFEGAVHIFELDGALAASVRRAAPELGLTLNMFFLLGWLLTLRRLGHGDVITVGFPTSGRPDLSSASAVGMLTDTAALRIQIGLDDSIREVAARLKERLSAVYDHVDCPFERIVEWEGAPRDLSRNPVFDASFVYERVQNRVPALPGARVTPLVFDKKTSMFDITLEVADSQEALTCALEYATSLFAPKTVETIEGCYKRVLEALVAHPDLAIAEIALLSQEERSVLITRYAGSHRSGKTDHPSVIDRFFEQARLSPDAVALRFGKNELTYAQLARAATKYAAYLKEERRVGPGSRVGLMLDRTPDAVVAILAALINRACYVPIDMAYPAGRVEHIAGHSGVCLIIASPRASRHGPNLPNVPMIFMDGPATALVQGDDDAKAGPRPKGPTPSDLAYIIYTSGTTGLPKGVGISHKNLSNYVFWAADAYLRPGPGAMPLFTSLSFDLTVTSLLCPLVSGNAIELFDGSDAAKSLTDIFAPSSGITAVKLTPAHIDMLAALEMDKEMDRTSIGVAVVGGEALLKRHVQTLRRLNPKMEIFNEYGPTETTVGSVVKRIGPDDKTITVGRPIAGTRIFVTDGRGDLVPRGVTGEVVIGGAGVADFEYVARDEENGPFIFDRFTGEGRLYRTGDIGRWTREGELLLCGRRDDQVKIRGHRIEPAEIEAALEEHPAIRKSVVLPVRDALGGQELCAWFVADRKLFWGEIKDHLTGLLPDYMVPSHFVPVSEVPVTVHGKIDRARLPEVSPNAVKKGTEKRRPSTPKERLLIEVFEEVLSASDVGLDDDFFSLGGDSIKALQIAARLARRNSRLEVKDIFEASTLQSLAMRLSDAGPKARQELITGPCEPTPIAARFFELNRLRRNHYTLAVLIDCSEALKPTLLEQAFEELLRHHDGLRLECAYDGPSVRMSLRNENYPFVFETHALESGCDVKGELDRICRALARSIDINDGPSLAAAAIDTPDGQRLLIACHHLVSDGVSLRILVEDLETAYTQLCRGQAVCLPPKTDSVIEWGEQVARWAASKGADDELAHWQGALEGGDIPRDFAPDKNTYGDCETVSRRLGPAPTAGFKGASTRFHPNDLLLAALARTAKALWGLERVRVMLEGHGRVSSVSAADVTRTVGWFTSIYPVSLRTGGAGTAAEEVERVRSEAKALPSKGHGYGALRFLRSKKELRGEPALSLNYLGDTSARSSALFDFSFEPMAFTIGESYPRAQDLELEIFLQKDRLTAALVYNPKIHEEKTARRLVDTFCGELEKIVGALGAEASAEAKQTRGVSDWVKGARSALTRAGLSLPVQDASPMTPLQEGMLFHHLSKGKSGAYLERFAISLGGRVSKELWERTWAYLSERHEALRAVYRPDTAPQPLQVIIEGRRPELSYAKIANSSSSADEAIRLFLESDARRGFDLTRDVLFRAHLIRQGEERAIACLSYPHILMDGWSMGVLLKDLLMAYGAFAKGARPALDRCAAYSDYCKSLFDADFDGHRAWWRDHLAGFGPLCPIAKTKRGVEGPSSSRELELALDNDRDERLRRYAAAHRVTLSALMQGIWAVVLSHRNRRRDVVFGCVVSDRPVGLAGVENTVGLFLSTLPTRVRFEPDWTFSRLCKAIQRDGLEARQHAGLSVADLKGLSEVEDELFDHIVAFENYPVDEVVLKGGPGASLPLSIGAIRSFEHTEYAFSVEFYGDPQIRAKFTFDAARCEKTQAEEIRGQLGKVIDAVISSPDPALTAILEGLMNDAERLEKEAFMAAAMSIDEDF